MRVARIDTNNRIHFSVINNYREGTSAGPGEMSDFLLRYRLTEKLRRTKVGNIPSRSEVNSRGAIAVSGFLRSFVPMLESQNLPDVQMVFTSPAILDDFFEARSLDPY